MIAGITSAEAPLNVKIARAASAERMHAEVMKEIDNATVFIGAAAVSDYRPVKRADSKIKKSASELSLALEPTPDILAEVATAARNSLLVFGFAAETGDLIENARQKLVSKKLDVIVANDITREGAGFDVDTNIITLLKHNDERPVELPLMSKLDSAHRILDEVVNLRRTRSKTAGN